MHKVGKKQKKVAENRGRPGDFCALLTAPVGLVEVFYFFWLWKIGSVGAMEARQRQKFFLPQNPYFPYI